MKIGIFLPNLGFGPPGTEQVGGIEVFALGLADTFVLRGHDVVIFAGKCKNRNYFLETKASLLCSSCVSTRQVWNWGSRFRKLVQRLHFGQSSLDHVREAACEIMLIFKPYDFINAARWKRSKLVKKVVMNYQGTDFFLTDGIWRHAVDWEFAASKANAELVKERYGVLPPVIPNAVNMELFAPVPKKGASSPSFLSAGRLVGWKGLRLLLQAFAKAKPGILHIAGDGPERSILEVEVQNLRLQNEVHFHGALKPIDLAKLFASTDYFLQPSIGFDACPTAVLQAMSAGKAVIMSNKVGLSSEFNHEEITVVPANNLDAWTQALSETASVTADKRSEKGERARSAVQRAYSWEVLGPRIEQGFRNLLAKK